MANRIPLIAANWKMYKTIPEAVAFVEELQNEVGPCVDREVVVSPPFTALAAVREVLQETGFSLAAQNCFWEGAGAYTGEVSPVMLQDLGCRYVIVGHSERRQIFGETDAMVRNKVAALFRHKLLPILCVGEVLVEREAGTTFTVVSTQIEQALRGLAPELAAQLVIAYEPVWAIGTGKTATPAQAQEVHGFLREQCGALYDKALAKQIRIVYGGSVKPDNVDSLMAELDIDGLLVGGASLEVASLKRIVQYRKPGAAT
jgi:triosephosphate isomerase (TIM)